jgi:hypothetical protein
MKNKIHHKTEVNFVACLCISHFTKQTTVFTAACLLVAALNQAFITYPPTFFKDMFSKRVPSLTVLQLHTVL